MRAGPCILRFPTVDQPKEFVDFKTLRNFVHQLFELCRGFRKMTGVILRNRSLKLAVEILVFGTLRRHRNARQQWEREKPDRPGDWGHSIRMLAPQPGGWRFC